MENPEYATTGPGGVPKGGCFIPGNPVFSCTVDMPAEKPEGSKPEDWFQGYVSKAVHPMYRTSNSDYGIRTPSVHTMPTQFHAKAQAFSKHLGVCGMYRNSSLNTGMDKSNTPDH